jgi:hypothetical protein
MSRIPIDASKYDYLLPDNFRRLINARDSFPGTPGLHEVAISYSPSSDEDASSALELEWLDCETGGDAERCNDAKWAAEENFGSRWRGRGWRTGAAENRGDGDEEGAAGAVCEPNRAFMFSVMALGSCETAKTPIEGAYVPRGKIWACIVVMGC